MKEIIRKFLQNQFLFEFDENSITSHTNLFTSGLVDSFGFVELISFLEFKFQIKFLDEELLSNSLNSLDSITKTIEEKQRNAISIS